MVSVNETTELVRAFNWNSPSWDLFIFLFWAVASVVYAFTAGRGRIISILISLYIAKLLVLEAPFLSRSIFQTLPESFAAFQQLGTFLILFLFLFVFLARLAFRTSTDHRHIITAVFYGLVFSILQIGLLVNTILTFTTQNFKDNLSPLIQTIFVKDPASFVWLILPLAYLMLVGRHVADTNEI